MEQHLALEQERARFGSLITRSSDLACVVDAAGEILYAPPWGSAFLGYANGSLPAPLSNVVESERAEASAWFREVQSLPPGVEARPIVLRFLASDGSVHTCDMTAENRITDASIGGIVLNAHDVSALVAAEARLAAVANGIADVIAISDAEARITWVSGAVRDALGIEPDDLVGVSAYDIIHPDDRDKIAERVHAFVFEATPNSTPMELRLRRTDGTYHWFESTANNQLADPSIRGLVISLRDITERRAGEAALRLSEERNRSIVETAADAIISVGTDGLIQSFNRAAEQIFAIAGPDAIGQHFSLFLPEDSLQVVRGALEGGAVGQQIDTIATRASGDRFPAHVAISDVNVGDSLFFTAVVRDISEQREMEQALRVSASYDELTGLPNRRTLLDRAQDAIDESRRTERRSRNGVRRPRPVQARQRRARSRRGRRVAGARGRPDRRCDPVRRMWSPGWEATNSSSSARAHRASTRSRRWRCGSSTHSRARSSSSAVRSSSAHPSASP